METSGILHLYPNISNDYWLVQFVQETMVGNPIINRVFITTEHHSRGSAE